MESDVHRRLIEDGWADIGDAGFVGMVGPFFERRVNGTLQFCFPVDSRHHNSKGVVQGGALMTFSDRAMGVVARGERQAGSSATIQFSYQFIDAVQVGEIVETIPVAVRRTSTVIFMNAVLTVGDRTVGIANGVWKRFAPKP